MKIISKKLKTKNRFVHSSKRGNQHFFDQKIPYVYKKNVKYRQKIGIILFEKSV